MMKKIFYWDFFLIGITVVSLILIIISDIELQYPVLRMLLSLPSLFIIPGYLLTVALFTASRINFIERLGLSIVFSLSIITFACLIPYWIELPINQHTLLLSLCWIISILLIWGIVKRFNSTADVRPTKGSFYQTLRDSSSIDKITASIGGFLVILGVAALFYAFMNNKPGERYTEMYLLNPSTGQAYLPLSINSNTYSIVIAVENHEYMPIDYSLQISVDGYKTTLSIPTLKNGDTWSKLIELPLLGNVETHEIKLELFSPSRPEPYRELHLWVDENL